MLARAVGRQPEVEKHIRDMLEPMFSAGLSPELTSALTIVSEEIPGLQREVQGGCGLCMWGWEMLGGCGMGVSVSNMQREISGRCGVGCYMGKSQGYMGA